MTNVKRRRAFAVEKIDAGRLGDGINRRTVDVWRQRRLPGDLARRDRKDLLAVLARGELQELPQRLGVAERPVPRPAPDAVALDQAVEVMAQAGIQAPRELDAAQGPGVELEARAVEFAAQEAVVEARVVRHEYPACEPLVELPGELAEARRARHHLARDPGERLDLRRNRIAGIHQGRPFRRDLEAVHLENRDLGDAVDGRPRAGRLEVDDRERRIEQHGGRQAGYPSSNDSSAKTLEEQPG